MPMKLITLYLLVLVFLLGRAVGRVVVEKPVDPIEAVQTMEATYRNITIGGDFGEVTIVGDDAERFLNATFPVVR
jgi:hypothetical protein